MPLFCIALLQKIVIFPLYLLPFDIFLFLSLKPLSLELLLESLLVMCMAKVF